ncbi:universal stress protein, partial [Liquorilactobacillus vini]|uniref:universal stress protein n=1 Tax=Liquorilactobacillus vini TaxID=238015 RepID=UPI002287673E
TSRIKNYFLSKLAFKTSKPCYYINKSFIGSDVMNQQPYQRILVAHDGSRSAEKALEIAADYARENNIQLDILYVLDSSIVGFGNTHAAPSDDDLYLFEEKAISQLDRIKND